MSENNSRRSKLQRMEKIGLTSRLLALLLAELVALALVFSFGFGSFAFVEIPVLMLIFSAVSVAMLLGMLFTEFPRGGNHTFTRLGLATFCRTAIPLLVVIAIWKYSVSNEKLQLVFVAILFYAVGHFGGIILSVLSLKS